MKKYLLTTLVAILCVVFCVGVFTACEKPTYTVTYVGGDGATGTAPTEANHFEGDVFKLAQNSFAKADYTFAGWSDGTKTYAAGADYTMPAANVTFTAQWTKNQTSEPEEYNITFEVRGSLVTALSTTVEEGNSVTLPTVESSSELAAAVGDATLLGWKVNGQGNLVGATYTPTADTKFVAVLEEHQAKAQYSVTYEVRGSLVAALATTVEEGNSVTLPTVESSQELATAVGKAHLLGWKVNGQGDLVGATYTPTADVKFVAELSEMPVVTFKASEQNDADSITVDAVYENGGWVVVVPQCNFTAPAQMRFANWYGYKNEVKTAISGAKITLVDFAAEGPYVFYADWEQLPETRDEENLLAGTTYYSFSANKYYAFGEVADESGYYEVVYAYNAYNQSTASGLNAWFGNPDTVRYSFDGNYAIQVKQDDAWVLLLRLDTAENLNMLEIDGHVYYKVGVEHSVTIDQDNGGAHDNVTLVYNLGVSVTLSRGNNDELTGGAEVAYNFQFVSYDEHDVDVVNAYMFMSNTATLMYTVDSTVYQVVVNFGDNTGELTLSGMVLTAQATIGGKQETYRATFNGKYYRLVSFEILLDNGEYREILTGEVARMSGIYEFTDQVGNVKTKYTVRLYETANPAYFTVEGVRETIKVQVTLTTSDSQYQADFQYDDLSDVSLVSFKKVNTVGDYNVVWRNFMTPDDTVIYTKLGNNLFQIYVPEKIYDGLVQEIVPEVYYQIRFVPASGSGEHQLVVKTVTEHDVTLSTEHGATFNRNGGYTIDDDGTRWYEVKFTVGLDGEIAGIKQVVVYRGVWAIGSWTEHAKFNFSELVKPVNGEYILAGEISSTNIWHFRIVITEQEGADGEKTYSLELHLQNEITFEINGVVIPELTVYVDENGDVTLPTAEELTEYLQGATFNGWKLNDQKVEGDTYRTGSYPVNSNPAPANLKFVADITASEQNMLAGSIYYDWQHQTIWEFVATENDGHYVINQYTNEYRLTMSATAVYYTYQGGVYTIYSSEGVTLASFSMIPDVITATTGTFYKSGATHTFQVLEGKAPDQVSKSFTFHFELTVYAGYYPSASFSGSDFVYGGQEMERAVSYSLASGSWTVQYVDGDTTYRAVINMTTMTSTFGVHSIVLYTTDGQYKAEFSERMTGGFRAVILSVKSGSDWKEIYGTKYIEGDEFVWKISGTKQDNVTPKYVVRYFDAENLEEAYFTVATVKEIDLYTADEQYRAYFEIDENGIVTLISLHKYNGSGYPKVSNTIERLNAYSFYVEGSTLWGDDVKVTVTFVSSEDDDLSKATMTVVDGKPGEDKAENELAGNIYYDWVNRVAWQFLEDQDEGGHYKVMKYSYNFVMSKYNDPNDTEVYYTFVGGWYTIYSGDTMLASFEVVGNTIDTNDNKVYYRSGVSNTYKITESGSQTQVVLTFVFDLTLVASPTSMTFVISEIVYNEKAAMLNSFSFISGSLVVDYEENNTAYQANISLRENTSTVTTLGAVMYSEDGQYRAIFQSKYGAYYLFLYVKEDNAWVSVTPSYGTYGSGSWKIEKSRNGSAIEYYVVEYSPEADGSPASFTAGVITEVTITKANQYEATFEINAQGVVTLTIFKYYDTYFKYAYSSTSTYYGTMEKLGDNVFYIKYDSASISLTITYVPGADGDISKSDFTWQQGRVEP